MYFFLAIALNNFLTQQKCFSKQQRVFFGGQKKITVDFATGPHLRNFDWVSRQISSQKTLIGLAVKKSLMTHQSSAKARFRNLGG